MPSTVWIPTAVSIEGIQIHLRLIFVKATQLNGPAQASGIFKLPPELLKTVTSDLSLPDIVSLGLTCKQMAVQSIHIREHQARLVRVEWERQEANRIRDLSINWPQVAASLARTQAARISREVREIVNRPNRTQGASMFATYRRLGVVKIHERTAILFQIRSFFDPSTNLCYACTKYVPRAHMDASRPLTFLSIGTTDWVRKHYIDLRKAGPRCQTCAERLG